MAEKDLMKALGGGGSKKIPWWAILGLFAVWEISLWAASLDWPLFIILTLFSIGLAWACYQDLGNVLMLIACMVFFTLLVGTRYGAAMKLTGDGVRAFGDTGSSSIGDLDVQLPSTGGPTTVAPAPVPAAAPPAPAPAPQP